jgi:hypothetical protein
MDQARSFVRDLPALGPGVKRIQFACSHGRTQGVLRAGSNPITDVVVLDLLRVLHDGENECRCTTSPTTPRMAGTERPQPPLKGTTHDLFN